MFSAFFQSAAAVFFPSNTPIESASSLQVDKQLQTELARAAEQAMVSTRSIDTTRAGTTPRSSKSVNPHVVVRGLKRKVDNGGESSPVQTLTKRRRGSAESKGHPASPSSSSNIEGPRRRASVEIENRAIDTEDHELDHQHPMSGSPEKALQVLQTAGNQAIGEKEDDNAPQKSINVSTDALDRDNALLDQYDQAKMDEKASRRSRKGKTSKKRLGDIEGAASMDEKKADISNLGNKQEGSASRNAKATHKRFGSEEIEVTGTVPSNEVEEGKESLEDISKDESERDDEAPDTVTASAGFDKARTLALGAAKVAARQQADKKLKRREHHQKLNLQAKAAKHFRSEDKHSTTQPLRQEPPLIHGDGQIPQAKAKSPAKSKLPLLLPKEILEAEPVVRAPMPPYSDKKLAVSQKRKVLDLEPKPPKDMKRGTTTIVRVLPLTRSDLPPKSSKASRLLRESWLTGRGVPRRKPSSSFIRNR